MQPQLKYLGARDKEKIAKWLESSSRWWMWSIVLSSSIKYELMKNLLWADRFKKVIWNFIKEKSGNPKREEVIHQNCSVTNSPVHKEIQRQWNRHCKKGRMKWPNQSHTENIQKTNDSIVLRYTLRDISMVQTSATKTCAYHFWSFFINNGRYMSLDANRNCLSTLLK